MGAVEEVSSLFFLVHFRWAPKPYSLYPWLRNTAIKATLSTNAHVFPLYIKVMKWGDAGG